VAERQVTRDQLEQALEGALNLLHAPHGVYVQSGIVGRRAMNQAVFDRLYIHDDEVVDAQLTELFDRLLDPDLRNRLDAELTSIAVKRRRTTSINGKSPNLYPDHQDISSNSSTLVAGTGFEPATSGL
jgi:site-specific DNA recombinase